MVHLKRLSFTFLFFVLGFYYVSAQNDFLFKIDVSGDFRFRIEQDWNSRKSDGTYREDRTRLRYRARIGANYKLKTWGTVGVRIRTGNPKKQQDPQLTLGEGVKEFGTLPIGFEKLFFETYFNNFKMWIGKNTFPYYKNNELFWSDNVYPEGVFLNKSLALKSSFINSIDISAGHFIIAASGKSFGDDAYLQGLQTKFDLFKGRLKLFPSYYYFKNIPNIPDGAETFVFNYSIFHLGTKLNLFEKPNVFLEFDFYSNLENYSNNTNILPAFKDEKNGATIGLSYGQLMNVKDWLFKITYNHLEQYAAVDFLAQNDWARWDYSSFNSPDGRLTNFKGIETVLGYKLNKITSLKVKYYLVEQLVSYDNYKENGNRIRFDIDVKL